ncbi:nuclear pore complex subunit Nup159, putative [Talaromyces stipitatus ATCC 10500]|uniref:Nuclear pore complex subunit Nup159, putative n=1 Tax=Talaromyces stipitatus (strain ATCC 10500 / CBS 375.48 / QM 6759 / NRRL 1006) TaxID=441959 RepID=B8LYT6_TALSN|nr:nuclear pore complex subunit Nup159, putative [Talaromyces stipitatus ATCC 10500]EED23444.1 nuclear pore complex subunit Nup159, putative [Talaromyces stipitatus ATCC 10500]
MMSFGSGGGALAGDASTEIGPELPEVETSELGFLGLDKDYNIQFLPTPWPTDALPAPTSSLLTISSLQGLVVGGGPEGLVLATTKSIRDTISTKAESGPKTKPFQPQAHISLPSRPTHVAFCATESALAVAMESHNQLVIYDSTTLGNGNPQPQISIDTNSPLRSLTPNPSSESDLSSLVALVTVNGDLLVADLKAGSLVHGQSGPIFRNGVASVTWSNRGKQMVAGLVNGSLVQLDPKGVVKAEIPRPPALEGNKHVSSISWLENNLFFAVYTPNESEDDAGMVPDSDYYIIERHPSKPLLYRQLPIICTPFGLKRSPAYHFIARLSKYDPGLKDALIISSTASTDIGLATRVETPFKEADEMTKDVFTTTTVMEETRRATLPLNADSMETSTIGLILDLTSTETVSYDVEKETKTPLPNIMVLTNEGVLLSWWFFYFKAIEAGLPYSTTATASTTQQRPALAPPSTPAPTLASAPNIRPSFGQPAFGQTGFGAPQSQSSVFGKPSSTPTTPSFDTTSAFGNSQKPTFGAPSTLGGGTSFASTTPIKPPASTFGSPGILGQRGSSFGQPGLGLASNSQPAFGQVGGLGGKGFGGFSSPSAAQSTFNAGATASGGGFSNFAKSGGFGAITSSQPAESPFGKPSTDSPFGKPTQATFGTTQASDDFKSPFGLPKGGFKIGSTFKPDEKSAADNEPTFGKPSKSGAFSLGSSFGTLLGGDVEKTSPPTESMDDTQDVAATPSDQKPPTLFGKPTAFGTPQSPITSPPKISGLFGTQSQSTTTPAAAQTSRPSMLFGSSSAASPFSPLSPLSEKTVVPTLSSERESVEAPLPPDATSRAVYGPGDTSASSNVSKSSYDEAPLPPSFTKSKKIDDAPLPPDFLKKSEKLPEPESAPLPPDFLPRAKETKEPASDVPLPVKEESILLPHESEGSDGDFEDSGEEITHDVSPPNETVESESASFKTSPESSFGGTSRKEPTGGLFTKVTIPESQPRAQPLKPLFGEIPQPSIPPPKPQANAKSPRSPSPVRPGARRGHLRPEQTRSTSAPSVPRSMFGFKPTPAKPPPSRFEEPLSQGDLIEEEESKAAAAESKRLASEAEYLSSDDEDLLIRAELDQPLVPAPTLDPFIPRQEYSGEHFKPGIPGQIERLYRDINSMIDTLGLNSRSISSYILYEEENRTADLSEWQRILFSDTPTNILDQNISISDIENVEGLLEFLAARLEEQRLSNVQEKINECQRLLSNDIFNLHDQCVHIQRILDSYSDTVSVRTQPLSAEQASLQQDLRKASTSIQSLLTELEQGITLLRAKIADFSGVNRSLSGRLTTKKPTVEAVTSTIATMMNMAESKSSDIDVLEAQMKKLGIELRSSTSREGSPISTPIKKFGFRVPVTPDSDGKRSPYQTPQSTSRFQASVNGSARHSRLRNVNFQSESIPNQDSDEWKTRTRRRKEIARNLKRAIGERKVKVRTMDDD